MKKNPFDGADTAEYLDDYEDSLEVYVGRHGHVCIRQTKKGAKGDLPIVAVHPSNIQKLVQLLTLAAEHSLAVNPHGRKA